MSKILSLSIILIFSGIIVAGAIPGTQSQIVQHPNAAPSDAFPTHLIVYSTCRNSNITVNVPDNSTGLEVYPVWDIQFFGSGSFTFSVNGSVVESGTSVGSYNIIYNWNNTSGNVTNAVIVFQGVSYRFDDKTIGPLSSQLVESVSIVSSCSNQHQYLSVSSGQSGALMYPDWTIAMQTTQKTNYSIFVNSKEVHSGSFIGSKTISVNITSNTATVAIALGKKVFNYPNEVVAHISIVKYYGPKPPALAYTTAQYEEGLAKAFVASLFGLLVALLLVRKYVIEKEKREVLMV
jgi:hypothetical protein